MPMPLSQRVDIETCTKPEPPHPCDPLLPCDPFKVPDGKCHEPYVCFERLKNPALPTEITRCKSGQHMDVKKCAKIEPPHPCDPPVPCTVGKLRKNPCNEPQLCIERIKNPAPKKTDNCDEFDEPYPPITNYPF